MNLLVFVCFVSFVQNMNAMAGNKDSNPVKKNEKVKTSLENVCHVIVFVSDFLQAGLVDKLLDGVNRAVELINHGASKVQDAANQVQNDERVQKAAHQAKTAVDDSLKKFNDSANRVFGKGEEAVKKVGEDVKPQLDKANENAKEAVDKITKPKE